MKLPRSPRIPRAIARKSLSPDAVLAAHRQLAADHGNQAERVIARGERTRARQSAIQTPGDSQLRAQEAVSYARDRSYEREAVTDERDIFRDALRRGMGETTYSQVRAAFDGRVEIGEFQQVTSPKQSSANQYTTLETIRAEMAVVTTMRDGQNRVEPIMSKEQAAVRAASREFSNPSQRAVIEEVLTSRDRIQGLQGLAGSGKTSALETIREGAERSGYAVEGFAPTGRAAAQLREAGIFADTLQGYLAWGGRTQWRDPGRRHLFMVDESSLSSTKQMREFLERIGPQDRVLLIGDTRQHQGVEAGKPFEQLQQAGMRTAQLDQISAPERPRAAARGGASGKERNQDRYRPTAATGSCHRACRSAAAHRGHREELRRTPRQHLNRVARQCQPPGDQPGRARRVAGERHRRQERAHLSNRLRRARR